MSAKRYNPADYVGQKVKITYIGYSGSFPYKNKIGQLITIDQLKELCKLEYKNEVYIPGGFSHFILITNVKEYNKGGLFIDAKRPEYSWEPIRRKVIG